MLFQRGYVAACGSPALPEKQRARAVAPGGCWVTFVLGVGNYESSRVQMFYTSRQDIIYEICL